MKRLLRSMVITTAATAVGGLIGWVVAYGLHRAGLWSIPAVAFVVVFILVYNTEEGNP